MPVIQGNLSFGFNDAEFRLEPADPALPIQQGRLSLRANGAHFRIELEGQQPQAAVQQALGPAVGAGTAQAFLGSFQAPTNMEQRQPVCRQLNFDATSPAPSVQGPRATSSPTASSPVSAGSNPNHGRVQSPDVSIISGSSALAPPGGGSPNNVPNVTAGRQAPPTSGGNSYFAARGQQQPRFPLPMPTNFQYANCTCSCTPCSPLTSNQAPLAPSAGSQPQPSQNSSARPSPPVSTFSSSFQEPNRTYNTAATSYGSTIGQIDMTMPSNETSNSQMAQAVNSLLQELEVSGISLDEVMDCVRERSLRSFNSTGRPGARFQ